MKIAIVAQGRSNRTYIREAGFMGSRHKLADETWAINSMGGTLQHDLLFHMDDCKVQESRAEKFPRLSNMVKWLKEHPKFYTSKTYPDYPGAMAFPIQSVVDYIGGCCYFNSTAAYALAYAITKKPEQIRLYGFDFNYPQHEKAERGRACVEMYCGIAMAKGIQITSPPESTLFDGNLSNEYRFYGYDAYEIKKDDQCKITMEAKELPTSEEIEARYEPGYPQAVKVAV